MANLLEDKQPQLNIKRMKTANLKNFKDKMRETENQEGIQKQTRYEIKQFN